MKILEEMNYEHKYLAKVGGQGSNKRARTSAECLKDDNLYLACRYQVSDVLFLGKGLRTAVECLKNWQLSFSIQISSKVCRFLLV